jgi:hypothetical protein
VHVGDGSISGFEVAEGDETVALGDADIVSRDLFIMLVQRSKGETGENLPWEDSEGVRSG